VIPWFAAIGAHVLGVVATCSILGATLSSATKPSVVASERVRGGIQTRNTVDGSSLVFSLHGSRNRFVILGALTAKVVDLTTTSPDVSAKLIVVASRDSIASQVSHGQKLLSMIDVSF
jgi:hypothetical protein